jgi:hypothetical protein
MSSAIISIGIIFSVASRLGTAHAQLMSSLTPQTIHKVWRRLVNPTRIFPSKKRDNLAEGER